MVDRKDGPNRPLRDDEFEGAVERLRAADTHYSGLNLGTLAEEGAHQYLHRQEQERASATDEVAPTTFLSTFLRQLPWIVPLSMAILYVVLSLTGVISPPPEN